MKFGFLFQREQVIPLKISSSLTLREKKNQATFLMSLTFELGKNSFRTLVPEHYSEIRGLGLIKLL